MLSVKIIAAILQILRENASQPQYTNAGTRHLSSAKIHQPHSSSPTSLSDLINPFISAQNDSRKSQNSAASAPPVRGRRYRPVFVTRDDGARNREVRRRPRFRSQFFVSSFPACPLGISSFIFSFKDDGALLLQSNEEMRREERREPTTKSKGSQVGRQSSETFASHTDAFNHHRRGLPSTQAASSTRCYAR